jgi:pyruvate,orthophosphate dikinase
MYQIEREIAQLEQKTGRTFGDPDNPLLVSVRSGAQQSMPGMMDTLLNVGINPDDVSGLQRFGGKRFARNTRERFMKQWIELVPNERDHIPRNPYYQLYAAIEAVLESWNSSRAVVYREHHNIPHDLGTAVTVQAMVFGNVGQDSCTGVVFSSNAATGDEGLYGDFLTQAQGEDVVAGVRTPRSLVDMEAWNPQVYHQLVTIVDFLAKSRKEVVDVEFTVEKGELYILQVRAAKLSTRAKVVQAVRHYWSGLCTKSDVLDCVQPNEVAALSRQSFDVAALAKRVPIVTGLPASPGAAVGIAVTSSDKAIQLAREGMNPILVRENTSPDDLDGMLVSTAIVTATGGKTCHAAIVARELGVPAVVGALGALKIKAGQTISVDGANGNVYAGALRPTKQDLPKEVNLFLKWWNQSDRAYTPRVGFDLIDQRFSVQEFLVDFYLLEALAREAEGTPLEGAILTLRHELHPRIAESFAVYLLMACAGESQHARDYPNRLQVTKEILEELDKVVDSKKYHRDTAGMHQGVHSSLCKQEHSVIIDYTKNLAKLFDHPIWGVRTSYGGKAWANIAQTLHDYLSGQLSMVLFIDRVFDLRHNGGPVFNKHPMFTERRVWNLGDLLDTKRDQQSLRGLVNAFERSSAYPSAEVKSILALAKNKRMC